MSSVTAKRSWGRAAEERWVRPGRAGSGGTGAGRHRAAGSAGPGQGLRSMKSVTICGRRATREGKVCLVLLVERRGWGVAAAKNTGCKGRCHAAPAVQRRALVGRCCAAQAGLPARRGRAAYWGAGLPCSTLSRYSTSHLEPTNRGSRWCTCRGARRCVRCECVWCMMGVWGCGLACQAAHGMHSSPSIRQCGLPAAAAGRHALQCKGVSRWRRRHTWAPDSPRLVAPAWFQHARTFSGTMSSTRLKPVEPLPPACGQEVCTGPVWLSIPKWKKGRRADEHGAVPLPVQRDRAPIEQLPALTHADPHRPARPPHLLADHGHGGALVQQAQLAVGVLLVTGVAVDAACEGGGRERAGKPSAGVTRGATDACAR